MILRKVHCPIFENLHIHNEIRTNNVLAYIISEKPAVDPSKQPYNKQNIWLQVSGKAKPTYGYKEQGNVHSFTLKEVKKCLIE